MRKKELIKKIESISNLCIDQQEQIHKLNTEVEKLKKENNSKINCLKDFLALKIKSFNKPEISLDISENEEFFGRKVFGFNLEVLSNIYSSIIPITSRDKKELLKEYTIKEIYNLKLENVEYYSNGIKFMFLNKEYYLAMNDDGTPKEVFLIGEKEK